ncbi:MULTISPECIES: AAA family ATPase [unclassified Spirosoma]|uniref:AAA family ATPase n=1 Tax=unclassified Spirosoma TaxID=2621999 RepID=UPI0009615415|nr:MULTISPECIES: AAA family ATPase [unclassified Spirosoma]MBN8823894.1 AAA family ATPase [Spirosoma sp.]OJW79714.1 MAG: hypothetical protein BGO59_00225 [Spirosoma sp. 48-14]
MPNDIDALIERNNTTTPVVPLVSKKPSKWKFDIAELDSNRITHETSFPEPIPVLSINGSTYAVENELSIITGLPKAGKSAVITAMIAAPFVSGKDIDTLSITAPPVKGRNVIYIDTEMSKGSTQKLHNQVLRMIDVKTTPKNLRFWNWKKYRPDDRIEALKATFELIPDIHIIFIDGIADFMASVNDEVKANELLEMLGDYAEEKKCTIITVIHENFGNGQARGHIGSGLGRKCAGTISIKKDRAKGITSIECKTLRHAPDFDPVFCQWDIDLKRLALVDETIAKALSKESKKTEEELEAEEREKLRAIFKQSFGIDTMLSKKELTTRVTRYYNPNKGIVSEKTADRAIKDGLEFGLFTVDAQKNYQLVKDSPF